MGKHIPPLLFVGLLVAVIVMLGYAGLSGFRQEQPQPEQAATNRQTAKLPTAEPSSAEPSISAGPEEKKVASAKPASAKPVPRVQRQGAALPVPVHSGAMPFTPDLESFSLCVLGTGSEPTLLVIGGIQGDEPGGFSAASLLATHYAITQGSLWVVPDLNFPSILKRNRGVFGDLNRKFAHLGKTDPEYATVARIKSILLHDAVDVILNLHDGSGFYRPTHEGPLHNPKRWGQSVIIDQETVVSRGFNQLKEMALKAEQDVNASLLHPDHRYHIRNTNTRLGDKEMEKTLSYFAVCNGKPAFGIEASKEFSTEFRVYYHILVIESFMRQMGIAFKRDFPLSPSGVRVALNSNLTLAAWDNKLILALDNPRPVLNFVPFCKEGEPGVRASKPLLALVREKEHWRVAYGNRTLTRVKPAFMDFDDSLERLEMLLDGEVTRVTPGEMITVQDSFLVKNVEGYRVNAIGAQKERNGTEAGVLLRHEDFMPRFSVDKDGAVFRVEVYKDNAFAGMVLVRFGSESQKILEEPMTASKGPESELGF